MTTTIYQSGDYRIEIEGGKGRAIGTRVSSWCELNTYVSDVHPRINGRTYDALVKAGVNPADYVMVGRCGELTIQRAALVAWRAAGSDWTRGEADRAAAREDEAFKAAPAGSVRLWEQGTVADGAIRVWRDEAGRLIWQSRSFAPVELGDRRGYVSADTYAAAVAELEGRATQVKAEREAEVAREAEADREALATVVPAGAVEAYRRYRGDDEIADLREDSVARDLIRQYGRAIEAQGLAR